MHLLVIGAGGHAQVVVDILLRHAETGSDVVVVGFLDDNTYLHGHSFLGVSVLGSVTRLSDIDHDAIVVAIGDNKVRQKVVTRLQEQGERFATIVHPSAVVALDVTIGQGSMICAGVVINTGTKIGAHVILNTGCTVDHHNRIGNFSHVAPGVHLGGEATLGEGALVGIGATVMPRCTVNDWATVGAGSLVHRDIVAYQTVVGVPARELKHTKKK